MIVHYASVQAWNFQLFYDNYKHFNFNALNKHKNLFFTLDKLNKDPDVSLRIKYDFCTFHDLEKFIKDNGERRYFIHRDGRFFYTKKSTSNIYISDLNFVGTLMPECLDVNLYLQDGFKHICDVSPKSTISNWFYENINEKLMYSHDTSWIYFLTFNNNILKVGETSLRLGIPADKWFSAELQPQANTKSRLGRYRSGLGTDDFVRTELEDYLNQGKVSFYAKPCKAHPITESIGGKTITVDSFYNQNLEKVYIEYFYKKLGQTPILNKIRR